jgi:DNA-binding beta-propeller fold protein YncE
LLARLWPIVLACSCGRIDFARVSDGGNAGDDTIDTLVPCGAFGTTVGEATFSDPQSAQINDANRITVTPDAVLVLVTVNTLPRLFRIDHALQTLGSPTAFLPGGNMGISYDPLDDVVFGYATATADVQLTKYSGDGLTLLAGPLSTGATSGAGFVDQQGHLHVVMPVGAGFREYDATLTFVGAWGNQAVGGRDAEIDRATNTAWHATVTGLKAFDLSTRGLIGSFQPPGVTPDALAIDDHGTLYVVDNAGRTVYAFRSDGSQLGSFTLPGEDPRSVAFDSYSRHLLIGLNGTTTSTLRAVCAYEM